jgi:GNAT superfamily N-acetyltransferase
MIWSRAAQPVRRSGSLHGDLNAKALHAMDYAKLDRVHGLIGGWTAREEPIDSLEAVRLMRAYFVEIVNRYHGRPMPGSLVDRTMNESPNTAITALIIARLDGTAAGCVGLRADGVITRMFVAPAFRRRGGGRVLIGAVEEAARARGFTCLRLDTRHDLTEARALYAATGFTEVEPFNDEPFAEHWFEKHLADREGSGPARTSNQ